MKLSNDAAPQTTEEYFERFSRGRVLERLRTIGAKATPEELEALDADIDPLIRLGMEIDEQTNGIRRNLYGVFHLGWQAEANPGWPEQIASELEEIRQAIRTAHGAPLRYLIWAGMGGSIEDKRMYQAAGLLGEEVQFYALDSTDPAKLKGILADMERRSGATLGERLRSTLVVGMAMGMTSYEPVVNLEKLARIYDQEGIDARANFLYLTLPGSLLDQFAGPRGFRRVELQPDGRNSAAGRHTGPLTKGSLYPLGLAKADLRAWIEGTLLGQAEILTAWRLAAFLHAQGEAGRDKVTLLLPKPWAGAGLWTKQNFEESLGKSEELGIKIVIGETPKLEQYRAPKDARQDRVFLSVEFAGLRAGAARARLEKAGFPLA
ncbi:MAG: hypothetical protein FJW37_12635, partial [Acidobacteria bacterium]|nr:hypothetical protein [Acidobacteriota bacterium]